MSTAVRAAFQEQAHWCDVLGSPFTARVCRLLGERLPTGTPLADAILDWRGDPAPKADSLPLRVAGALHCLARRRSVAGLAEAFPPNVADDQALWRAIEAALNEQAPLVHDYLQGPPQTNEVARSGVLLPGLLEIARRTGLPLDLHELGASAGLNLILDRYRYRFGDARWGDEDAGVLIAPEWSGPAPPVDVPLRIAARQGVDLQPIDLRVDAMRERLASYVWADMHERLQRLEAAMAQWQREPPTVARADVAPWLEGCGFTESTPGVARVVFHSVVWSYLPQATRERLGSLIERTGTQATQRAPVAWLRFELAAKAAELRLRTWPGGGDDLLAVGHPHGARVHWLHPA